MGLGHWACSLKCRCSMSSANSPRCESGKTSRQRSIQAPSAAVQRARVACATPPAPHARPAASSEDSSCRSVSARNRAPCPPARRLKVGIVCTVRVGSASPGEMPMSASGAGRFGSAIRYTDRRRCRTRRPGSICRRSGPCCPWRVEPWALRRAGYGRATRRSGLGSGADAWHVIRRNAQESSSKSNRIRRVVRVPRRRTTLTVGPQRPGCGSASRQP